MTYGTFPLGRSVMNVLPRLAVDSQGDAHILFQNAPRTYLHAVFAPDGKLRSSEYFGRDYSAVSLESTPGGAIKAIGKVAEEDLTKPLESVIENR